MRFYDPEQISRGIKTQYLGPSPVVREHAETAVLWAADEPVPSRPHVIGKLTIGPNLLAQANRALTAEGGFSVYREQHRLDGNLVWAEEIPPSPFLGDFLKTCAQRFQDVIRQDLLQMMETTDYMITDVLSAGPYSFMDEDGWHREDASFKNLAYSVTANGPVTEFAAGAYRNSDFDEHFFTGRPSPKDVAASEVGDILVYDGTSVLNREPMPKFNGHMRLDAFVQVHNVFN